MMMINACGGNSGNIDERKNNFLFYSEPPMINFYIWMMPMENLLYK
jgi:hypothetical protein